VRIAFVGRSRLRLELSPALAAPPHSLPILSRGTGGAKWPVAPAARAGKRGRSSAGGGSTRQLSIHASISLTVGLVAASGSGGLVTAAPGKSSSHRREHRVVAPAGAGAARQPPRGSVCLRERARRQESSRL
jgi:hypothetical protein